MIFGSFKYYKIITILQNVTKYAYNICNCIFSNKSVTGTRSRPSRITLISTKVNKYKRMRLKP